MVRERHERPGRREEGGGGNRHGGRREGQRRGPLLTLALRPRARALRRLCARVHEREGRRHRKERRGLMPTEHGGVTACTAPVALDVRKYDGAVGSARAATYSDGERQAAGACVCGVAQQPP